MIKTLISAVIVVSPSVAGADGLGVFGDVGATTALISADGTNPWASTITAANTCSPKAYLTQRPDVAAAHVDPFDHYVRYGHAEGMCFPEQCTAAQYLASRPDVARADLAAQAHWAAYGLDEGMCEPSGHVLVAAATPAPTDPAGARQPASLLTRFPGSTELLNDPFVKTGFQKTDACPNVSHAITANGCATNVQRNVANPLYPDHAADSPKWTYQQWGSRLSLPGGAGTAYGDGIKWDDGTKHFAIFPEGVIEMGVNGLADWQGAYPQNTPQRPGWPSSTLGYAITNAGNPSASPSGTLDTFKHLFFQMDARLSEWIPNQRDGFDPNKNKTTMGAFLSIQNLEPTSAGYGQFVWFSIPVFDSTNPVQARYSALDSYGAGLGTNMLIFTPGLAAFTNGNLRTDGWVHWGADILSYVNQAVDDGIAKGALKDGDKSHYYVGGFTIGWESLAFDQATIQFKDLSVQVVH